VFLVFVFYFFIFYIENPLNPFKIKRYKYSTYLRSDHRRKVPISAKKFRDLEGFPTQIQPTRQRPIKFRLSRAYLQKMCTTMSNEE